jgi:hypothetical protein
MPKSFLAKRLKRLFIVCTSGNISCTVTCDSGYIFNDGNKTKIYDCHSRNVWTPVLPVDTCISKYGHPLSQVTVQLMLPEVHTMLPLATLVGKDSLKHASAKGKINMKKIKMSENLIYSWTSFAKIYFVDQKSSNDILCME